jgi:hypothetical protein
MARYVPNVVLETEFTRPTSIWAVAVLGTDRLLRIELDTGLPSATFLRQALKLVPATVPYFGRVIAFRINYKPTFSAKYDLHGTPLATFDRPATIGAATLVLDPAASEEDHAIFGRLTGERDTLACRTLH